MKKLALIYWSGSGNTEIMAQAIQRGIENAGQSVDVFRVDSVDAEQIKQYDALLLGCPAMGSEVLEESEFEPFFADIEDDLKEKQIGLFGSYGWGDGEWMRDWEKRVVTAGAHLFEEGLMVNEKPEAAQEQICETYGGRFAKSNQEKKKTA